MSDLFGKEEIRALSWKEPFASLMLHGKIETRRWDTKYRGLVLICSSQLPYGDSAVIKIAGEYQFGRICKMVRDSPGQQFLNFGHAIAIGRLINSRPMTQHDESECYVSYSEGLYCHIYEDVRPIKPFLWKGSQGWRRLTQEQIDKIELF
ncbi:MAG TPA: hypothetical protein VK590_14930 [Saprospiraceae bacterium]|nr:hypothetical protein [Saprospiraceae bacterium]